MKTLNISLRPKCLDEIIGQETLINSIKNQFKSGRIPHFFLISGPTGSGKTTLARIIALMLQNKNYEITDYNIFKYDIREINASDKNGIDDIRSLIETIRYKPLSPSISKIIIMDEAHQLTTPAQNALLKDLEDTPEHVYFILCTNMENKLSLALRRRAVILSTTGINKSSVSKLVNLAKESAGFTGDVQDLLNSLKDNDITSPGLILQAAEKYFSGGDIQDEETTLETKNLCNSLSKGIFDKEAAKKITKDDIHIIRAYILGYFKTILLSGGGLSIAKAMLILEEPVYELPIFLAKLRILCETIKS